MIQDPSSGFVTTPACRGSRRESAGLQEAGWRMMVFSQPIVV